MNENGLLSIAVLVCGFAVAIGLTVASKAFRFRRELCRPETFVDASVESLGPANPTGRTSVDVQKLLVLDPPLASEPRSIAGLARMMSTADGQPAVVASIQPLLVCVYNDEIDACVWLSFPDDCATGLQVGQKLACATTYSTISGSPKRTALAPDLSPGPADSGSFDNLHPIVVDLVSSDSSVANRILAGVPDTSWRRLQAEVREALHGSSTVHARDGRPSRSHIPARGALRWMLKLAIRQFV